jgi:spore coat polysaccharide biosynthesis predicted glycosyltransferase SpsG
MRCLALAEELAARGSTVRFVADLADLPFAARRLAAAGLPWVPPGPDPVTAVLGAGAPDAVVLDSYLLPPSVGARLHAAGVPVLALVDGDSPVQPADLYLDQNLGAERDPGPAPRLAGLRYALQRAEIRAHRPARPPVARAGRCGVLAFFGGTDPYGAAPVLAAALAATGVPCDTTVVAATPQLAAAVHAVPVPAEQARRVIGPTDELARLVTEADLVVAAAGTSAWELACLGAAAALVCVVDNQRAGYRRAVGTGAVAGLGELAALRADPAPATTALRWLLSDRAERTRLHATAWHLVDGHGTGRVADALAALPYADQGRSIEGAGRARRAPTDSREHPRQPRSTRVP